MAFVSACCIHKGLARAIFFYFLVYGSSDPNFCILEKIKILFLTFFIFCYVKDARFKKLKIKKNNKNCMILHCKNAEMTIIVISAFLQCKIIQFLLNFFLRSKYVSD